MTITAYVSANYNDYVNDKTVQTRQNQSKLRCSKLATSPAVWKKFHFSRGTEAKVFTPLTDGITHNVGLNRFQCNHCCKETENNMRFPKDNANWQKQVGQRIDVAAIAELYS